MKFRYILFICTAIIWKCSEPLSGQVLVGATEVDTSTLIAGLDTPWEILWGPDDHIWITERKGIVSRIDPETGQSELLATVPDVYESGESGLLGMVLHPDFENHPFVYLVYNYYTDNVIKEKLVRYTYAEGVLDSPVILMQDLAGRRNHDGSRILIDKDYKLFFSTGDAGNTSLSQDLDSYNGKILRINLNGSIPDDNPLSGSPIWSWGHRNPQGLVLAPSGILYSSEHGPASDDEVNIIMKGGNYGWPEVYGFCDETSEEQFCLDSNVVEPLIAWTPTLAVSGLDYYNHSAIPEWQGHLLLTTLKAQRLVSLELSEDGLSIENEVQYFTGWWGRLRDLCVAPDGRIFLAVSNLDGRGDPAPGDDRIIEIRSTASSSGKTFKHDQGIRIYPNPTTSILTIEIGQPELHSIEINSLNGQLIYKSDMVSTTHQIDISSFSKGVYFVTIRSKEFVRTEKIVKL